MIARSSRKKKGLAVEGGGVVEDWYAGNAIISKSSIAKAFICDKSKANCQQTLGKTIIYTTTTSLEGLCCKASSWSAAKLEILGHSTLKQTCLASTCPSVRRGKHV